MVFVNGRGTKLLQASAGCGYYNAS
jgi:hypothetical protein